MKADKTKVKRPIAIAKGQLEGITKMIDQDEYCIDISNQILAIEAILRKANNEVLAAHCKSCVANASTPQEKEEKIEEIIALLSKMNR